MRKNYAGQRTGRKFEAQNIESEATVEFESRHSRKDSPAWTGDEKSRPKYDRLDVQLKKANRAEISKLDKERTRIFWSSPPVRVGKRHPA